MRYVKLAGASVPAIGQGTWYMGEDPGRKAAEVAALQQGIELGLSLIALRGGIPRIDNHQQIAFFHALVIAHPQLGDVACRFWGNRHHVAVGKGVVSRLFVTG